MNTKFYTVTVKHTQYYCEAYLGMGFDIDGDEEGKSYPTLEEVGDCFIEGNDITEWNPIIPDEKLKEQLSVALQEAIDEENESDLVEEKLNKMEVWNG
jgi:hypothetical protein